jgi:hypothetical protein
VATSQAQPIRVDGRNCRSDDDALEGGFVNVVAGPYKGRVGVFTQVLTYSDVTGYPTKILVRTRDDEHELIGVEYASVRPKVGRDRA